ncbi:Ig-like domain repeat protein [uncultured Methanobrevibacter sp.]|uniref:Ig-like domain repeat protein n=1 Tax=uncultured Methanobrevibacter sp. TaxID=253161 RepID=UPI0025E5D899|nr:Ig-like domain repeat protein [uncultured Methanobrevibacter sp.]
MPCTYVREFNVAKLNTTFSIPDNIEAGKPATINVTLNKDATGIVRLHLNSNNYLGSLVDGSAVFKISDLPSGIYDVSINYDGDSKYAAFNKQEAINVTLKNPVLNVNLNNIIVGNDVTITPIISNGATGDIEIYVDDDKKSVIDVGYSYVFQESAIGKHEVKLNYSGDNYFKSCENTTSFWVFAAYPIEAEDTYIIYNTNNYFKAKFYDENHNVLSNKYVVFNVGGKDYARLTDDYGWATLDISLDIGIYNVTSINAIYNEKTTNKIVIFSSIQSENLTRAHNSSADFYATFLDNKAKPLSNTPVIFKVNGSDYTVNTNMDGQAELKNGLDVGTHEIMSINPTTGENKTNIVTIVPSIQAKNMVRAYNSSMDFKATFIGANNDYLNNTNVTFEIGSRKYPAMTDEKGIAILNVPLAVGQYKVTAVNPVTHERLTKKLTIVERIVNNTDMVIFTDSKVYFKVVVIDDNAAVCGKNEEVIFTLNNKNYTVKTDKYGYASLSIPSLKQGAYQINTTYKGFTVSNTIAVFKEVESIISIDADDVNYMENVSLNVSVLPKYMHGNLNIRIISNNKVLLEFNTTAKKVFSKKLNGLNASDYLVTVNFTDTDNYYASNDFSIFKVLKIDPKIIIAADAVDFNQDAKITINIPNVKGNVIIRVGDVLNSTEHIPKNGVIVKTISKLDSGKYPINVKFEGNNNYNPLNATAVLKVNKLSTTLKLSYVNNTYNNVTLTALVNPSSAGGNVVFTVNGKNYTSKISRGKATYKLSDLSAGSYTVNAVYKGDVNHKTSTSNSIKFTVPKRHVNIAASDVTKIYGGSEKLVITLTNPDSKAVSNVNIKVSLAGKDYTLTTDKNGKASLSLDLNSGTYTADIIFAGNNEYLSASTSAKVIINKLTPNIDLYYTKNSYNTITLTANVDSATASGNVVFNVNGKDYIAKISNGKATYTLYNLNLGSYNAKATYNGDINHKASASSSINFNVVERYVVITAPDVTKNYGGSEKLEMTLTNQDFKAVGNAGIKVSLAGKDYTLTTDKNGKASLNLDLNSGTCTADIVFVGNSEYLPESTLVKVIINQLITNVSLSYIKDTYNSVTLTAAVNPSSAGGNVIFTVNGKDYTVKISGGKATLKLSDLAADSYTVKSVYGGDVNHKASASNSIKFTVSQHYVNINASDVVKFYGGSEKLEITLINQDLKGVSNAEIRVSLDGTVYTLTTDKNGKASLDLGLDSGIYDAYIVFVGNEDYKSETKIVKITINRLITNIGLSYIKDTYNSVTLTAAVNPSSTEGIVVFTVNDKDYEVKLSGGKAILKLSDLAPASYDVEATYVGDTNHMPSISNTIIFTVEEPKYKISAPDVTKYYHGPERFVVTVKDKKNNPIVNGKVTITLNGVPYNRTTDANGQASMAINLDSGIYNVTTEYDGIFAYSKIIVKTTIESSDITKIFRNGTQYYATFRDSNGNLLRNTDVNFNINGVFYTRTTNENGVARMNINLLPKQYVLTAMNPISGESCGNLINVLPNIVENYDLTKYYKNASKFTFRLLDDQGRPVGAGVSASLNINGVFYTRQTDANGYINMNINLNPGTYIATIMYNGLSLANTIKVLPILEAKDIVMKYRDGTKFEAKLLDGQGKPFAGQTVTFNINGVMYNRITDGSGIARLNINLMPGEYIITSMYENGATIANKVTIRG